MRIKPFLYVITTGMAFMIGLFSCNKDWLDAKPNKSLVVPSSLQNYQALLDNTSVMNQYLPGLGEAANTDYYITEKTWKSLKTTSRAVYIWADDPYESPSVTDWNLAFTRILNANVVLDGLQQLNIADSDQQNFNNIKGSALFYRALDFYCLAQIFCPTYNSQNAESNYGLPLRRTANINERSQRSTLQKTYDQITKDLIEAAELLPETPLYKTRPCKAAATGLLARVYLVMGDYPTALKYADACLASYDYLMDFNSLDASSSRPIATFNPEVIYHCTILTYTQLNPSLAIVDSVLFASYDSNDLRREILYRDNTGEKRFWGSYNGQVIPPFCGIATDEVYLIKAECLARENKTEAALSTLNALLKQRWKKGTFVEVTAINGHEALKRILIERRKELFFRGLRWTDLRRLNSDTEFATTLMRKIGPETYTLKPGSPKYTFPIPENEIERSGITQNPR